MCTLSFVPESDGYLVGMNRDEQIARGPAVPPERFPFEGGYAIYPRESNGGTWIAANSFGVTLALLNWYSVPSRAPKSRSRGELIPQLIIGEDSASVQDGLAGIELGGVLPFRLFGIFPVEKKVTEWRWDQRMIAFAESPWTRRHWFSSGVSDEEAERNRGSVCSAPAPDGVPTREWLRTLHRSHENGPGPFSICVHRPNVLSLSYTEVSMRPNALELTYLAGSPCEVVNSL